MKLLKYGYVQGYFRGLDSLGHGPKYRDCKPHGTATFFIESDVTGA